jgi:hypothetical protein
MLFNIAGKKHKEMMVIGSIYMLYIFVHAKIYKTKLLRKLNITKTGNRFGQWQTLLHDTQGVNSPRLSEAEEKDDVLPRPLYPSNLSIVSSFVPRLKNTFDVEHLFCNIPVSSNYIIND